MSRHFNVEEFEEYLEHVNTVLGIESRLNKLVRVAQYWSRPEDVHVLQWYRSLERHDLADGADGEKTGMLATAVETIIKRDRRVKYCHVARALYRPHPSGTSGNLFLTIRIKVYHATLRA